jgi:hypothetical protein
MFGIRSVLDLLRNRGGRRRQPARCRPAVQALEDRCLSSTFQEFPLPPLRRDPQDEFHRERIAAGPDGNLWFTDGVGGSAVVGRITPDGSVTEFSIEDNTDTQLYTIRTGPDGNLWLTGLREPIRTNDAQLVAIRLTPDGNYTVFQAFPDGFASSLSPLIVGSDGNLWYDASFYAGFPWDPLNGGQGGVVGRITQDGAVTNFDASGLGFSAFGVGGGITAGADGNLWIGLGGVRPFTPDGQGLAIFPGSRALTDMLTDADGNAWGLVRPGLVERITQDGTVSDFPLPVRAPTMNPEPELDPLRMTITAGPDGNIWFSDPYANQIGNITPGGAVTEYAVPTPNSFPAGITTGPDGNIWFTELGSSQIGEFVLDDGGGAGGAARSAPPAKGRLTVSVAAVEALSAGTGRPVADGVASSQPPTAARVDAPFTAGPPEAVTVPTGPPVRAAAGILTQMSSWTAPGV